jgi:hypothetical protein
MTTKEWNPEKKGKYVTLWQKYQKSASNFKHCMSCRGRCESAPYRQHRGKIWRDHFLSKTRTSFMFGTYPEITLLSGLILYKPQRASNALKQQKACFWYPPLYTYRTVHISMWVDIHSGAQYHVVLTSTATQWCKYTVEIANIVGHQWTLYFHVRKVNQIEVVKF